MKVEEIIKRYEDLKNELNILEIQISSFEGISENDVIEMMTFSQTQDERVITSGTTDKTSKIAASYSKRTSQENDEMYNFLLKRHIEIKNEIDFFESAISRMKYKEVAEALFIQRLTWPEVESLFNISHATIGRHRREIVKELEKAYSLRNEQIEAFLLS